MGRILQLHRVRGVSVSTSHRRSATGIVSAGIVDGRVIFAALTGAIVWNVLTWNLGIPSSSSHALIGGLTGAPSRKPVWARSSMAGSRSPRPASSCHRCSASSWRN
jgi:hypothetical protein